MPKSSTSKSTKQRVKVKTLQTKAKTLNAKEARNVKGGLAVDPSDPSGNTVYVGSASGGVWKTTETRKK